MNTGDHPSSRDCGVLNGMLRTWQPYPLQEGN